MGESILSLRGLTKSYGRTTALAGLSLDVERGELFGLLGPNGAGKTTLLSMIAGLLAPTTGEVRLHGAVLTIASREARRQIGLATQDLAIYPELTARENLEFFGHLYGLGGNLLKNRVQMLLDSVALADRANHRTSTFSGGMKRRLNLAAALVHEPSVLLLDEPTTGVDPQSRRHIFEQVRARNAAGLTVIYTSHYMEEVQELCPRIAIVDHGALVACDRLAALLARHPTVATFRLDAVSDTAVSLVRGTPGVDAVHLDGPTLRVESKTMPQILPALLRHLGEVQSLSVQAPSLERVFLTLTGHALRD